MIKATVAEWHAVEGHGVLAAPELVGGCWFGFGSLATTFEPAVGMTVWVAFERGAQDGYAFRARQVSLSAQAHLPVPDGPGHSSLDIVWDDEP